MARFSSKVCFIDRVLLGLILSVVIGVKGINVPIPLEPTVMTCTLNNGIHFVTTPDGPFSKDCRIEQEFELYVEQMSPTSNANGSQNRA